MEGDRVAEEAARVLGLLHHQESGVQVEGGGDAAPGRHHQGERAEHRARDAGGAAGAGAHGCEPEQGDGATAREGAGLGVKTCSPAGRATAGRVVEPGSADEFLAPSPGPSRVPSGSALLDPALRFAGLFSRLPCRRVTAPPAQAPCP